MIGFTVTNNLGYQIHKTFDGFFSRPMSKVTFIPDFQTQLSISRNQLLSPVQFPHHQKQILKMSYNTIFAIMLTIVVLMVHFVATHMYATLCTPLSLWGFVTSIFTVASPSCDFLLSVSVWTAKTYVAAWVGMGLATLSFLKDTFNHFRASSKSSKSSNTMPIPVDIPPVDNSQPKDNSLPKNH
jgi:hypothetical protein